MGLFRERLLARLVVERHAISPELVAKLVAWKSARRYRAAKLSVRPSGSRASAL